MWMRGAAEDGTAAASIYIAKCEKKKKNAAVET